VAALPDVAAAVAAVSWPARPGAGAERTDAERLVAIGCRRSGFVGGNLKFDVRAAEEAEPPVNCGSEDTGCGCCGGQHAGRRRGGAVGSLAGCWMPIRAWPCACARHPERFAAVAALLVRSDVAWEMRSDWRLGPSIGSLCAGQMCCWTPSANWPRCIRWPRWLLSGQRVAAGGHNPLEPAQFGVPIVMGPHYANFRAITEDLVAHNALRIATVEELAGHLSLAHGHAAAEAMGARARQVFDAQAGATARSLEAIKELLAAPVDVEVSK